MYDFTPQKEMYLVADKILKTLGIEKYALGGGTALSAHYWQHRYSTDIDIFLFEEKSYIRDIRNILTNDIITKALKRIGYKGALKFPGHYLEIEIDTDKKIQFFETPHHHANGYIQTTLWNKRQVKIETIDEIIYKKLFYRAQKGNARDIFDIAVAIHNNPSLFEGFNLPSTILPSFIIALQTLVSEEELTKNYNQEIQRISPALDYMTIAYNALPYVIDYVTAYVYLKERNAFLGEEDLCALEAEIYTKQILKN